MTVDPKLILRKTFPGMLPEEADCLITQSKVCTYPAFTLLCREGALETTVYIILEGEVSVNKNLNDREVRRLNVLGPGDFFGEMANINNAPRSASVLSISPITVMEISREAFSDLLEHSNCVALAMVRIVSRRLRENDAMAIEDLRSKSRDLADAYQKLAEEEYARRQFLNSVTRELRSPLISLTGFLQAIRTGSLEEDELNANLETVTQHLQDITSLVNDILFLQEQALILPAFQLTNVDSIIRSVVSKQVLKDESKLVTINVTIASNLPFIMADEVRLEKAIVSVLDNAVKFCPNGGKVDIEVSFNTRNLVIQVTDNGLGIPPEALPHIFDRFFHLDEINGHYFRGAGLGLSIARQIIEYHQGNISATSQFGNGSIFTIQLPLQLRGIN
jgi:signal transduction histidine kinase